ncbi:MAG TPA: hypothetical protein VII45_06955 [Solirubrobacterales bacterium]
MTKSQLLMREKRWSMPVALVTLAGVALLIGSVVAINDVRGEGSAEILQLAHQHHSSVILSTVLEIVGFILLTAPLIYLFRADQARSKRVRAQLIGIVVAAPLFLALSAGLNAAATTSAASEFVAGNSSVTMTKKVALEKCHTDLKEKKAKAFGEEFDSGPGAGAMDRCVNTKIADDTAENAISDASTRNVGTGFGLAGRLGLAFTLFYTCLWAMRTGLLTRFWASLGIALGAAALLLLVQFTLIFFLYFGLLVAGWLPRGRPPAWAAGEAIPWPTPGEKAAASLEGPDAGDADDQPEDSPGEAPEGPDEPKRKRKQRD